MESVISTREEVERFLSTQQLNLIFVCGSLVYGYDDYGDGDNFGSGYGNGYRYDCRKGDGCGQGTVDGNGFGCGCGYAHAYVTGIGYGDGTLCGSGFDYGNGEGSGSQNIKMLNGNIVDYIDRVPTIITQVRDNIACGYIIKEDLTLDSCFIAKVGNFFAHGKTIKFAVMDAERKGIKKMPIEERIKKFIEVFGSLDSEHKGKEFYEWHHVLTGSCRMGRNEFCRTHNIDLEKKYTVKYFLDITDESYGNDVIKLIRKEYKNIEK